ncbi:MAG TPA: GDP-fucose synthetase [Rhodospirillaceae bacterium]|nr:GDP-fucose synthetase [Candidatus Neomarinimicrobiota bacterium]HCX13771.1 GDP-fucose synthetase [Rhodospirillaceae bacterium]
MTLAPYSLLGKRVWVAGHSGMVGTAITRRLNGEQCIMLTASHKDLDLTRQRDVEDWMAETNPQCIFLAAAVVGGIFANDSRPAKFLTDNLQIQTNIISTAHKIGAEKLLFLGSSCIYPKLATQPINEDALLSGPLEPTNQWYAVAKIAGVKQCQAYRREYGCDFISAMPTNLYGPDDNFDLLSSHVLPALIVKAHNAKIAGKETLTLWGSGKPRREFLYVEDLADACVFLIKNYSGDNILNVGYGSDITIRELAEVVSDVVGFKGEFEYDLQKPDGTPQKLLDFTRLRSLGWRASTDLRTGIAKTYEWYLQNEAGR